MSDVIEKIKMARKELSRICEKPDSFRMSISPQKTDSDMLFADAFMASIKEIERLKKENEKLKRLMLLTDPSVSNIVVGETQIIQWNEFIKAFPEYNTEAKY